MRGLLTIVGLLGGAGVGGFVGWLAAFVWADWEGVDALTYIAGGIAVGATAGAYLASELGA